MTENQDAAIQWERVYKKVTSHAFVVTGLWNTEEENGPVEYTIGDKGPVDLAHDVFRDFLEGKIKPLPGQQLTEKYLINLLKNVLEKRFLDHIKSSAVKTTAYAEEMVTISNEDPEKSTTFFDGYIVKKKPGVKRHRMLSDPQPAPDHKIMSTTALQELYNTIKDEQELEEMVRVICEHDLKSPGEIASHLKTTVTDINNRQKKLRRRFKHLVPVERKKKAI